MTHILSPHIWISEPKLTFDPIRNDYVDAHPLRGLSTFGPYSEDILPSSIRIATIAPETDSKILFSFLKELKSKCVAKERKDYIVDWPGFNKVFKIDLIPASRDCLIEINSDFENEVKASTTPHILLADKLNRTIQLLCTRRTEFDVVVIYMPKRWSRGFTGSKGEDFDLHDHLKAITAAFGVPIQIIRDDRAISYSCRASVMWHVGLALYAKAGGIPWKLADSDNDIAYIGISYALRSASTGNNRFITCCSQVFDADGAGLEFITYDAHEVKDNQYRDNPFLSRHEMFNVITRSLDLYRRRHAGRTPSRVMIHKSTEFKKEEINGCMEALHLCKSVDLVQIVKDPGWAGVRIDRNQYNTSNEDPTPYPVERGTVIGLGGRECLLWMHGDVRGINNKSYFKGSRSTPRPIKIIRHAGHGGWEDTARATLALSKMNWNNDALYDQMPVTMSYASVLARIIKRMPTLKATPYQFRFFM